MNLHDKIRDQLCPKYTIVTGADPEFNHCPTICEFGNGILLAYYGGIECTDRQKVFIEYWVNMKLITREHIWLKTGNPVLWNELGNAGLIFSLFIDNDLNGSFPVNPVDRWSYCINYYTNISINNNKLSRSKLYRLKINPVIGCLGRCQPIYINNKILFPFYREKNPYGIIIERCNNKWNRLGKIGDELNNFNGRFGYGSLIQPTLWVDTKGIIHSLSRDITILHLAWYSKSLDFGYTWSKPIHTMIENYNNSLVAINDGSDNPFIIWNNSNIGRYNLTIGELNNNNDDIKPIYVLSHDEASYPNYCITKDNTLYTVFAKNRKIILNIGK